MSLDDTDADGYAKCSLCGGDAHPIGTLGNLAWYRCRDCGMNSSREVKPQPRKPRKVKR